MIQIYSKGNTRFDMNGDMILFPETCSVRAELNGTWKLDMVHPRDQDGRWRYIEEECIISVPTFMGDRQLFRICEMEKTDDEVTVAALPVFLDCADDCYLMDVRPTNKNGQEALNIMTAGSRYSGQSDITSVSTAYFEGRSLADAISGSGDPTFLGRWGGEILYDNYKIIINERIGGDYGVEARYGKNMEGIEYCLDMAGVVTRIVPMAYNGYKMSGNAPWVDSPNINKYEKKYIRKIKYDHIKMREDAQEDDEENGITVCDTQEELDRALAAGCRQQFEGGLDTPVISITINMVELSCMEEYKEYRILEKVSLGDDVTCRHKELDITTKERVTGITWDCIRNRVEKLTLGEESYNYFSSTNSSIDNMDSILNLMGGAVRGDGSIIAERVKGFLDATKTQLRIQNSVAKRQEVRAILFEDTDPESELYGALAIGTQGLQISKRRTADNRDWDWTTAATANGIVGNTIVTGLLSDKKGLNFWNLDTGEMQLVATKFTLSGGATIDSIAKEKADEAQKNAQAQAAKQLEGFINSVYDPKIASLQNQIDGQIETWYYDHEPTLSNVPASGWESEEDRKKHEGDLFYWKSKGYSYRFFKDNGAWKWQLITDSDITKALSEASKAQDTADSKRRIFTTTPYTPYDKGDLWTQGKNGDIKSCVNSKKEGEAFADTDWELSSKYISEEQAKDVAKDAVDNQTQSSILDKITRGGKDKGIYLADYDGDGELELYISFNAIRGGAVGLGGPNNGYGIIEIFDTMLVNNELQKLLTIDGNGIKFKKAFGTQVTYTYNQIKALSDSGNTSLDFGKNKPGAMLMNAGNNGIVGFTMPYKGYGAGKYGLFLYAVEQGEEDDFKYHLFANLPMYISDLCASSFSAQSMECSGVAVFNNRVVIDGSLGSLEIKNGNNLYINSLPMKSGENAVHYNSGRLQQTARSSMRYKNISRALKYDDIAELYKIQPVMASYKSGYLNEDDERYGKTYPMFIAEDIEKYFPIAVDHNEEGGAENWNSRVMVPAMFQMIKSQKESIGKLTERIERLENLSG